MKKIIIIFLFVFFFFGYLFFLDKDQKIYVRKGYEKSQEWMLNNFKQEGFFVYKYEPSSNEYIRGNNMIRQLMMSRQLGVLTEKNPNYIDIHKKNLEYILNNWYVEKGDYGYIYYSKKSKLGANAMFLRVIIDSPFYELYKEKASKIANTIEYLQKNDGSFSAWYIEPNYRFDEDYLLTFYSGEALLALVEFYEKTGNKKYLEIAKKSADYYINKYVDNIEKNYYPAYVPWYTIALNKLYKIENNSKYSNAIYILNNKLLEIQNQFPESKYYGRFYNPDTPEYGSPHSSSDGIYTEGLIYAYEIAKIEGNKKHMIKYKKAIDIGFDNLLKLQYNDLENKKLYGALKYSEEKTGIRVDTVSHFMDACEKFLYVFDK